MPAPHLCERLFHRALSEYTTTHPFVRVRFVGVPSTVEDVVRVRFCCLLSWKSNTGNTGRTVLGHGPILACAFYVLRSFLMTLHGYPLKSRSPKAGHTKAGRSLFLKSAIRTRYSARMLPERSKARKPWSANRELRGWRRRGCREGCQEQPEKAHRNRELEAKKAHKPWIREGRLPWSANRELGTLHLQNSSVSVHSLHFMVCAPLNSFC